MNSVIGILLLATACQFRPATVHSSDAGNLAVESGSVCRTFDASQVRIHLNVRFKKDAYSCVVTVFNRPLSTPILIAKDSRDIRVFAAFKAGDEIGYQCVGEIR